MCQSYSWKKHFLQTGKIWLEADRCFGTWHDYLLREILCLDKFDTSTWILTLEQVISPYTVMRKGIIIAVSPMGNIQKINNIDQEMQRKIQAWWYMSTIPKLSRWKQENQEFKASLGYVRCRLKQTGTEDLAWFKEHLTSTHKALHLITGTL